MRRVVIGGASEPQGPSQVPGAVPPVPNELAGTSREAGNWIAAYLEYTKESESPDAYHVWCALSAIASVTRRNVWADQGIYLLYPNLYVALVGPPGRTGKSTAIRMGRRLISQVPGIRMGPDSCTREQLIRKMAEEKLNNQCCLTLHSTEFSSIIDPSGILMIQFLTEIYDCDYHNNQGWKYETKSQGKDELVSPCLNILAGTTPSYIADSMPDNVVGHGFTSRTIFVYGDKERQINPRPKEPDRSLVGALIRDLQRISSLGGEFRWDPTGIEAYDRFYHGLYKDIPQDHRLEGYHWRKKIHVLKVAMILCMAERDTLILDRQVVEAAVQFLDLIEGPMARTFSAVGKYDHASDLERIGSQVLAAGGMPLSQVWQNNYFAGSEQDLRTIIAALISMGVVKLIHKDGEEFLESKRKDLPWNR